LSVRTISASVILIIEFILNFDNFVIIIHLLIIQYYV
jgi:hypothetical protein